MQEAETKLNTEQKPQTINKKEENDNQENGKEEENDNQENGKSQQSEKSTVQEEEEKDKKPEESKVEIKEKNKDFNNSQNRKDSPDDEDFKTGSCLIGTKQHSTLIKVIRGNIASEDVDAIGN